MAAACSCASATVVARPGPESVAEGLAAEDTNGTAATTLAVSVTAAPILVNLLNGDLLRNGHHFDDLVGPASVIGTSGVDNGVERSTYNCFVLTNSSRPGVRGRTDGRWGSTQQGASAETVVGAQQMGHSIYGQDSLIKDRLRLVHQSSRAMKGNT